MIPAVDRSHMTAITLGGSLLVPDQGSTPGVPVFALYLRQVWEDARTRDTISLFVNELEYDKSFGPVELVSQFENYTLPFDQREVAHNHEIKETALTSGTLLASLGPGLRFLVSPREVDNDIRLQLVGRVGYFYAERAHHTGPGVVVPPSTLLYGARLRGRYDGMSRNLLELAHEGVAAGWDLDYLRRDKWRDLSPTATGSNHRDFLQLAGHLVGAAGIPGLSERNRVVFSLYGGKTLDNRGDRFNAFLINGGPFPSEADDLARPHYSGILFEDVRVTSYATASVGYRRELAFFLYGSVLGSYIWADRATVQGLDQVVFREKSGAAATVSLDSAFPWNSELYLAYSWESGFIRGGKPGSGIAIIWNKMF
jgi:hypothetical protein